LAVSPALLRLLESISDTVILFDPDWRFAYLNPRAVEEAGEPADALLGRTLWEKYPALVGTDFEANYRRAVAEQTATHFETRGIFSGRWLEVHAYPSPEGLLVYGRDISDRKRAEAALAESEERNRLIAELTSDYAYTCSVSANGQIRLESATEGLTRVTGYTLEELEACGGWLALFPPEDRDWIEETVRRLLGGASLVQERRIVTKDGRLRWIRYLSRPTWDLSGTRVTGLLGAVQDVTERRLAEDALRASEERFQRFMDNSPALAWVKDEHGRYVYANRPHLQRNGLRLEELRGRTDFDIRPAAVARRLREADLAALAAGTTLELTETVPDPDGTPRHWQAFKFPFRDAAGVRYVGGMAVEVTERLRDRQKLQEYAGHLQALSRRLLEVQEQERRRLARELHDEVGQVLTGVSLTLQSLRAACPESAAQPLAEAVAVVARAIQQVRDLSLDLRPSMLDDLGLEAALRWYAQRLTRRAGLTVHLAEAPPGQRPPAAVETACFRVAQEALTNTVRHAGARHVWVDLIQDGAELHLIVRDDGAGFDVARARRRAAAGGSFGLLGMQERVDLLGGRLEVESSPAQGTCVHASFPLGDAGPAPADNEPS
jgi:PAS domain S-box-containing protein